MDLPINSFLPQILDTVINNPCTIISAETGAGKSTEVPRLLSKRYRVVVTQPRIVAAVELARRVADLMGDKLGGIVGYASSEEKLFGDSTRILFVTDGLQLAKELHRSGDFPEETVLIIDELHEWNMNIEVLLALAKSRNIHVVLMSATMEADKISRYMNNAPVIRIPGRTFPVEQFVVPEGNLVNEIVTEIRRGENVLIFLPGKKEIEEIMTATRKLLEDYQGNYALLPLHGHLTPDERSKVFQDPKDGEQRAIFATNIAQTSLTIPYITTVIDTGLENRLEMRDGVEGLNLGEVSRADLAQRAGRAGRVKAGRYILCSDVGPVDRPDFPRAEIQRVSLEMTYLRLLASGIEMGSLDFYHQPTSPDLMRAQDVLLAFQAIDGEGKITPLGHKLSKMPLSVRSGIMILKAAEAGVISEITTIVAILEAGDLRHKAGPWRSLTRETKSDLLASLDLYNFAKGFKGAAGKSKAEALREQGIFAKNFYRALNIREMVVDSCCRMIQPKKVEFRNAEEKRQTILSIIREGFRDSIYERSFRTYHGPFGLRSLDRESVVFGSRFVVGLPFDISGKNAMGAPFDLKLLIGVTEVDEDFVRSVRVVRTGFGV